MILICCYNSNERLKKFNIRHKTTCVLDILALKGFKNYLSSL